MGKSSTAPAAVEHQQISIVRLHGEACFYCGAAHGRLLAAGSITTPVEGGGVRVWPIVACPRHSTQRGVV